MTLRDYLQQTNHEEVYRQLREQHAKADLKDSTKGYVKVVTALLALPVSQPPDANPITIENYKEGEETYYHVGLRNLTFVEPPKGLEPWGCQKGEKAPEGHFNVNDDRYSPSFGIGLSPRNTLIDREMLIEAPELKDNPVRALAELLWEITFYGFDDKEIEAVCTDLKKTVDGIKDGSIPTYELDLDELDL
jgi:hypothetical protein